MLGQRRYYPLRCLYVWLDCCLLASEQIGELERLLVEATEIYRYCNATTSLLVQLRSQAVATESTPLQLAVWWTLHPTQPTTNRQGSSSSALHTRKQHQIRPEELPTGVNFSER